MEKSTQIQNTIRELFAQMQTKEQLLEIINLARVEIWGQKRKPFKLSQLTWYYNVNINNKRYYTFSIKKKSGQDRQIHAPVKGLKNLQKALAFILDCVFEPHLNSFGFVTGKSIVDNANRHANARYVYNIDLKDFFPSIDQARVWKCLQLRPFNLRYDVSKPLEIELSGASISHEEIYERNTLNGMIQAKIFKLEYTGYVLSNGVFNVKDVNGDSISYSINVNLKRIGSGIILLYRSESTSSLINEEVVLNVANIEKVVNHILHQQKKHIEKGRIQIAGILAALCCTNMEVERKDENGNIKKVVKNVLPQGAPTSPIITNIVCQRLDHLLTGLANRFDVCYSRYADDITFSSNKDYYNPEGKFVNELRRIITDQNFEIKDSKTRLQKKGYRQEVTGLTVNDKANVRKRYVKQLRSWIYIWEKFGYAEADKIIMTSYMNDKGNVKKPNSRIENIIKGKLEFLKMVKGPHNSTYLNLYERYEALEQLRNESSKRVYVRDSKFAIPQIEIPAKFILSLNELLNAEVTNIVDDIFESGLDKAMENYNP